MRARQIERERERENMKRLYCHQIDKWRRACRPLSVWDSHQNSFNNKIEMSGVFGNSNGTHKVSYDQWSILSVIEIIIIIKTIRKRALCVCVCVWSVEVGNKEMKENPSKIHLYTKHDRNVLVIVICCCSCFYWWRWAANSNEVVFGFIVLGYSHCCDTITFDISIW